MDKVSLVIMRPPINIRINLFNLYVLVKQKEKRQLRLDRAKLEEAKIDVKMGRVEKFNSINKALHGLKN